MDKLIEYVFLALITVIALMFLLTFVIFWIPNRKEELQRKVLRLIDIDAVLYLILAVVFVVVFLLRKFGW